MGWGVFKKIKDGFLKAKSKLGNIMKQATPYVKTGMKAFNSAVDWANNNPDLVGKNLLGKANKFRDKAMNVYNKATPILPDLAFK